MNARASKKKWVLFDALNFRGSENSCQDKSDIHVIVEHS